MNKMSGGPQARPLVMQGAGSHPRGFCRSSAIGYPALVLTALTPGQAPVSCLHCLIAFAGQNGFRWGLPLTKEEEVEIHYVHTASKGL